MYHCHLHFYFIGRTKSIFETLRAMSPLECFTHTFSESDQAEEQLLAKADVIFVDLCTVNISEILAVLHVRKEGAQLIVLAEKEQISHLSEHLSLITDIWILPLDEEELRFRFLRWQQLCKRDKDSWQASQYLETTINSVPNLIWYKNKDGIHEKVNDSFCKTVNKTKEQVEGRDHYYIWDVDPAELEGNDCEESDRAVMRERQVCVSEETVQAGGNVKLLTTYKAPLYDLDGSVMGTAGIGIDITQERAYEQEILQKNTMMETVFTTLDCGVLCHTVDGRSILSVNQAALKILGYSSQEELEEEGFNMVAPSVIEKEKLRNCISTLQKEGDSVSVEYRVRHKSGEIIHVMGNIKLIQENGELFYRRFLLDCTAQKLQEEKDRKHQLELIQALSIDYNMVFYFDLDTEVGNLLRAEDEGFHLFDDSSSEDITLQESIERYIREIVYEDDKEMLQKACLQENLKKELEKRKLYYVNYRAYINGEIKYYEMKVVRFGVWGENHGIVLGFRSVDEETRHEKEQKNLLEDALLQANRASQAKSLFLSNMSHDIRTPMNAIVGFTTLAKMHLDNKDRVKEYLDKITTSGNHMIGLINDVLDMSRIESGKMQLEETSCCLSEIMDDLKNMLQVNANDKHLELKIEMKDVSHEDIICDKMRLNRVLLNVLNNSIKYTRSGGNIHLLVTEKPQLQTGYVSYEFCIRDNGIGMSEEFLTHVFEPFEREKNTTVSGIQGTGLGMAITKNIVNMMNGTIVVKSKQNVGTEVMLNFMFRMHKEAGDEQDAAELQESGGLKQEAEKILGGRILMAEDNDLNREIAIELLSDAGFEIEVAENGRVAVDMLKDSAPGYYNLVLMDVQMPVMNGYEATKLIRRFSNQKLASIPIFAMTANAFEEDKQEALKSGMNGHIAKPVDVEKLLNTLRDVLG